MLSRILHTWFYYLFKIQERMLPVISHLSTFAKPQGHSLYYPRLFFIFGVCYKVLWSSWIKIGSLEETEKLNKEIFIEIKHFLVTMPLGPRFR